MSLEFGYWALDSAPPPHGFIIDIVEKEEPSNMLFLRFYADDLLNHPESEVQELTDWLNGILKVLNNPLLTIKWTWEVSGDTPPNI